MRDKPLVVHRCMACEWEIARLGWSDILQGMNVICERCEFVFTYKKLPLPKWTPASAARGDLASYQARHLMGQLDNATRDAESRKPRSLPPNDDAASQE